MERHVKKNFLFTLFAAVFVSPQSHAEPIRLVVDPTPFFQCGVESVAFLGEKLGNQLQYKGDRVVTDLQTFFDSQTVYTSLTLAPLPPRYFEETWLVKSDRSSGKCVPVMGTINAEDDLSGGGGISVHN
jgi:hypothetical protein